MRRWSRRAFVAALLKAGGLVGAVRPSSASDTPLRFGVTPVILDDDVGFLKRWSEWLAGKLDRRVVLVQRTRYQEIVDLLLRGQLHLAWICGYPYVQHQGQLELIAVPLWHGRPLYRSEFIVPVESEAQTPEDLAGRLFAWTDPDSNSGWLYPRFRLDASGFDPDRFFRRSIFTWGHARSLQAVANGLVDGAAVDSYVRETLMLHLPPLAKAVRVIERSPLFGFPPIVAGPALDQAGRRRMQSALFGQATDTEGRALLANLNLDGFSTAGPEVYADIAAMAEHLGRSRRS